MLENNLSMYQKARKEAGLTQEQAAECLDVSVETVKAWERAQRRPRPEDVERMIAVYGTPWLALEHLRSASGALGVLPERITIQGLPTAVLQLINRATALANDYQRLMEIAEDGIIDDTEQPAFQGIAKSIEGVIAAGFQVLYAEGAETKKERSEAGTSKRSGSRDLSHSTNSKTIIAQSEYFRKTQIRSGRGVASR